MQEIKNSGWSIWGRSFFGFIGIILLFYATGNARQADVALLNRTSPIFVTIFAGLFLKERISFGEIISTALCLLGAFIAMQPSFDSNPFPLFAALLASIAGGIAYTMLSYCKNFASPTTIIYHFSALSTICSGLLMIRTFAFPPFETAIQLVLIGIFAALGQFLLTYAYQKAPASEVSIYQFSGVVFTALLSFVVFNEPISKSAIVGGAFILIRKLQ